MLDIYLQILKDLIDKGEIEKDDKIVDETRERLIDMLCYNFPQNSLMHVHIELYVNKVFDEKLGA